MQSPDQSQHAHVCNIRQFASRALSASIAALLLINTAVAANGPRMIEVSDETRTYTGMIVAKSAQECFIVDRFGCQTQLPIRNLKSFSVIAENFRPASQSEFRRMLEAELGSEYEVATSKHYVVCGIRGRSRSYAALFEEIFHQVDSFYSLRGFRTSKPDAPLVALILQDQTAFRKYCENDQMPWTDGLRGYYSTKTNRIAMYDCPELFQSVRLTPGKDTLSQGTMQFAALSPEAEARNARGNHLLRHRQAASDSAVTGETANTIVHEATHQVGFNIGIHSRLGGTPAWLLEGMATVLEAPGMRTRTSAGGSSGKVNQERLDWFKSQYANHRQPGDLAKLIASDDLFHSQTLDAYSVSWGMTWFLTESPARARLFSKYLRIVSEHDPLLQYTPEERLTDFQTVFGDISRLEVDYIRAMDRL